MNPAVLRALALCAAGLALCGLLWAGLALADGRLTAESRQGADAVDQAAMLGVLAAGAALALSLSLWRRAKRRR